MADQFYNHYYSLFTQPYLPKNITRLFIERLNEGNLTRDENTPTHFCVYFAVNDLKAGEVFMGKHKKSGLWLFNGGHIDKDELPEDAVLREMEEELGITGIREEVGKPFLLTITHITIPPNYPCKTHYDIWYSVEVDKNTFQPDQEKLSQEFLEYDWFSIEKAKELTSNVSTMQALISMEKKELI